MEKKYDRVLFSKAHDGDVLGKVPPPPTEIVYTPEEQAILDALKTTPKKKKGRKMPKKDTLSWERKACCEEENS